MMESREKTASMTMIWAMTARNVVLPADEALR